MKLSAKLIGRPFSREDALKQGISRNQLAGLVSRGEVGRVARGIYYTTQRDFSEDDAFRAATLKAGKTSAICLLSALAYYDLTDEIPNKVWIMLPASKRIHSRELQPLRVANPKWNIGIEEHKGFKITSLERSIVEALVRRRQMGSRIGIDAVRAALDSKRTTLRRIYEMAGDLGVADKLLTHIEVLG